MARVALICLVCCFAASQVSATLTLIPDTPNKEVFTGEPFVITCLNKLSGTDIPLKLKWINPEGQEVPSRPAGPIYVSEITDGLQIVFFRHLTKSSGVYKCISYKPDTKEEVESTDFTVKIYKSIEFFGATVTKAAEGETFSVQCNAKFDPQVSSYSVVWDKTGKNIVDEDSDKYTVKETKGPNLKSTLTLKDVSKADAGLYTCRATQFTPTISQFKQHEVTIQVQYKPKFSARYPPSVYIDRKQLDSSQGYGVEVNFSCIVDADPPATLTWYDSNGGAVFVDHRNFADSPIKGIHSDGDNVSFLTYHYKEPEGVTTQNWPPGGNQYDKPNRPVQQPNVRFDCAAKNDLGSIRQTYHLRVGELPVAPRLVRHSYVINNLTLTLTQPESIPAVDFYKIVFSDQVFVEFNATASETEAPITYTVPLDNVPSGSHNPTIYAHNPVGFSLTPLRDPSIKIQVVSGVMALQATLSLMALMSLLVLM